MMSVGHYDWISIMLWIILLISHIGIVSLLFLRPGLVRKKILICCPLVFILIHAYFLAFWFGFFLIPLIFAWILALTFAYED